MHFHGGGSMCDNLLIIKNYFCFHLYNIFFSLSLDQFAIN
ncbi:membrane protein [Escherichia coli O78:H12 str. 00-3279]|nr:membrane protein [Escherichia coli O78:H12 str. 00-3279]